MIPSGPTPHLRTLGALELIAGDARLLAGRRKVLAALAYLARQRGSSSRSTLATLFWGERDEVRARQSLRNALSELRGVLGAGIEADDHHVRLAPGALGLDIADFEAAVREERWDAAADMWSGEFLPGAEELGQEDWNAWLVQERTALHSRLGWTFARLVERAERAGDALSAMSWASRWSEALPHDEEAAAGLLEALLQAGRGAEAAARHAAYLTRMRDVGREPGPRIRRLADRLAASSGAPALAQPRQALLSPALVDRDDVLERLSAAWQSARAGTGRVAVIEADEGLGKSRLCRELGRSVRRGDASALVLEARAYASEQDTAWSTLRALVRQVAGARGLGGAPPESLAALAALDPELRVRFPGLPSNPGESGIDEGFRRVIEELALEQPVLLMLDDAPLADRPSLRALAQVLHRVPERVLIVLTGRHDAFASSPLSADLRQGAGEPLRMALGPLDRQGIATLLASMAPVAAETVAALSPLLLETTAGVPGHVAEAITRLAEEGDLLPDAQGEWRLTRPVADLVLMAPSGARDITLARLSRLPEPVRQVLEAAAVVGPVVDPDLLEAVTELPAKAFQDALGDLLLRRLLRGSASGPGAFEFSSEITRRSVYELIAPSRRRLLHRRIARFLSARPEWDDERLRQHRALGASRSIRARRWVLGGIAAAGLASAVVWGVAGTPAEEAPLTVVLADPRNTSGDSVFDEALLSAATVGLQQSRRISIFPRHRVREVLTRMGRTGDSVFDEPLAREVAEREGLRAVVALAVERAPAGYQLSLRVVEPESGRDLSTAREVVSREQVLEGLDRLIRRARRGLGETARQVATDSLRLPRVTTSSLEALKAYADGRRAWARRDYAAAGQHWRRAVRIDSAFAMALAALADYAYLQVNQPALGEEYLARALALTDRLSERERLALQYAAARYRGRPQEAVTLGRLLAERYPERDTWFGLGTVLMRQQRCPEAIPALQSALKLDSTFANGWINLATCHQILDQPEPALDAYTRAAKFDSMILRSGNLNQEWGRVFVRLGRLGSADSAFRLMLALGNPVERARGLRSMGFLRMYEGRYAEAIRDFRAAAAISREQGTQLSELRNRTLLAEALITAGRAGEARTELVRVDELLEQFRPETSYWFFVAHAWHRAGRPSRAEALLTQVGAMAGARGLPDQSAVKLAAGLLALGRQRPREALEAVADDEYEPYAGYRHAIRADAYYALGIADSALAASRALASGFHFGFDSQDEWLRAGFRVGRLAETLGDTSAARAAYGAYLERWGRGDSTLPELVVARDRLATLERGGR